MQVKQNMELSSESKAGLNAVIIILSAVVLGTFIITLFDKGLAISMNHIMISILPATFEQLKFVGEAPDIFQKAQLIVINLLVLTLVILYSAFYVSVLLKSQERAFNKTIFLLISVYVGFYIAGFLVTSLFI